MLQADILYNTLIHDFYAFVRYANLQLTGEKFLKTEMHARICYKLQDVYEGRCNRLIINVSPRYGKTSIAVIYFMAWCLAKNPDCEFIHASYGVSLASENTYKTRNLISEPWYKALFPNCRLEKDSKARDNWKTTEGGVVVARGTDGPITGFGAGKKREAFGGALIIDDPIKPNEASSQLVLRGVQNWYTETAKNRLNNPSKTPVIVIMQRLNEEDLSGWLLAGGSGEIWDHLCIPARNEDGTAVWPFMHNEEMLAQLEQADPYSFAGQYMQRPAPRGGGMFKNDWWQLYTEEPTGVIRTIQSWDTAFKAKTTSDYSCCVTIVETKEAFYLLDVFKAKLEFPDLKRAFIELAERFNPSAILVEDKASGQSLIQELQNTNLPVIPCKTGSEDKVARASPVTGHVESGRVWLKSGAHWVQPFIASLGTFPSAKHDDDVDAFVQAMNYLQNRRGNTGLLELYRQNAERFIESKPLSGLRSQNAVIPLKGFHHA